MTNKAALGAIALSVLLLAAGCGKDKPGSVAKAGGETPAAGGTSDGAPPPPEVETTDANSGPATEPDVTPVKNAVEATRSGIRRPPGWAPTNSGGNTGSGAGARARAGLAKYVDWRPRESEGGLSFLAEPAVRRAVAAVRDARSASSSAITTGPTRRLPSARTDGSSPGAARRAIAASTTGRLRSGRTARAPRSATITTTTIPTGRRPGTWPAAGR